MKNNLETSKKEEIKEANIYDVMPSPKVLVLSKINTKSATIIVEVYDIEKKKNVIHTFSNCEMLPDGSFRKKVNYVGLDYLYFPAPQKIEKI